VYDPAQARIEAESVAKIIEKYHASDDEVFRTRALIIKENRAELAKEHLWVLWTDYFKPPHLEQFPGLHDLFWRATKKAGEAKHSVDPAVAADLLSLIAEIDGIFQKMLAISSMASRSCSPWAGSCDFFDSPASLVACQNLSWRSGNSSRCSGLK
jgi:nickel superoxide dismutase